MPAEGQHGPGEGGLRVGGRAAVGRNGPAFGQGGARPAVQFDLTPRGDAGGKVKDVRVAPRAGPAKGEGIGPHQRIGAARRGDAGITGAHGHGNEAHIRQRLDLRPKGGEMGAVVDHHRGDPGGATAFGQQRRACVKRSVGESAARVHAYDGAFVMAHLRHGVGCDFARFDRAQAAFDPIDAVRFASVAFARHDHPRQG